MTFRSAEQNSRVRIIQNTKDSRTDGRNDMNIVDSQTATTYHHTIQTSPMTADNKLMQTVETPYNNNLYSGPFETIRT